MVNEWHHTNKSTKHQGLTIKFMYVESSLKRRPEQKPAPRYMHGIIHLKLQGINKRTSDNLSMKFHAQGGTNHIQLTDLNLVVLFTM